MSNSKFKGMAECQFCGSGTFEPIQIIVANTITGIYCKRCWKEYGSQPVDNPVDNTPKHAQKSVDN